MEENIKVYVKIDINNVVTDINSNIFIQDIINWIQIDEGQGDKYSHAQNNYLEKGLMSDGKYNYKLVDNKPVELTKEEKETLFHTPTPQATKEEALLKEVANLKVNNMEKDLILTNAVKMIANLKVEMMNLKGGN